MLKIKNMTSENGKEVPNQFIVETDSGTYFRSYQTNIAKIDNHGIIYLDQRYWNYSPTTGKYRNKFLGMDKNQTEKAIKNGDIVMTDLN